MTATAERHTTVPTAPAVNHTPLTPAGKAAIEAARERIGATAAPPAPATREPVEPTRAKAARYVWAGVRIALGWTFLWAFLDKTFGLGQGTEEKAAWINGGHPTLGFLKFGAAGPFADFYHGIAGATWADWLFMTGLAALGTALILGIGLRIAAIAGGLLYLMMWTVVLPPENNPIIDDHLINAAVLAGLALVGAGNTLGLGRIWARIPLVARMPWLK